MAVPVITSLDQGVGGSDEGSEIPRVGVTEEDRGVSGATGPRGCQPTGSSRVPAGDEQ